MIFSIHPNFGKELTKFLKKHHQDDSWLDKFKNLMTKHYEGKTKLGSKILAQVGEHDDYNIYKATMVVGGLHKNNCPRVCFAKKGQEIVLLCFGTHIDNYKTKDLVALARKRIKELLLTNKELLDSNLI